MLLKSHNHWTFWIITLHFVTEPVTSATDDTLPEETATPFSTYEYGDNYNYFYSSGDYSSVYTEDDEDGFFGVLPEDSHYYTDYKDNYDGYSFDDAYANSDAHICDENIRIGRDKVCDGRRDCHDCSDEVHCTDYAANFFSCYETSQERNRNKPYTAYDPRCIPLREFCDGLADCLSGHDEIRNGSGFKCLVKDKFRTCVLPGRLLCDGVANCEDRSDVCEYDVISGNETYAESSNTVSESEAYFSDVDVQRVSEIPKSFFKCLSARDNTKSSFISQKQVCDGLFDCLDLSDECLCQFQRSEVTRSICEGLCTPTLWADQKPNPNCQHCKVGHIYRAINLTDASHSSCLSPIEAFQMSQMQMTTMGNSIKAPTSTIETPNEDHMSDVIICIDQSLENTIRARKCDGRPECFFGEDECGIGCNTRGDVEWLAGSGGYSENQEPPFCDLRTKELGSYTCLSNLNQKNMTTVDANEFRIIPNPSRVVLCDGFVECPDGSDEAFCPTFSQCRDSNSTNAGSYDILQKCDGYAHCLNGADENPSDCARVNENLLPCGDGGYFDISRLIDGNLDCLSKADECPPFLSQIPEIRRVLSKNDKGEDIKPPPTFGSGLSSHHRAIDNLSLQIFLVAASFIGLSALSVSLVLVLYNTLVCWGRFINLQVRSRDTWLRNSLICLRESVVNLNLTISKILVCGYFAYIKITRSEDSNYGSVDLGWRSSRPCTVVGALCFIGTQIPIFSLAGFAITFAVSNCLNERRRKELRTTENGQGGERGVSKKTPSLDTKGRAVARILVFIFWFLLQTLIWVPVVTFVLVLTTPSNLHIRTQTYAWTTMPGAITVLKGNLLDQNQAMKISSIAVALANNHTSVEYSSDSLPLLDFHKLSELMATTAPSLRMVTHSTYGYFGQSGSCLPDFLVHVNSGQVPYHMAVSNYWSTSVSIAIVVVDMVLILLFAALTLRNGSTVLSCVCDAVKGERSGSSVKILNSTFSSFVLVESLTWLFIFILFVAKFISSTSLSDNVYMVWCLSLLGINCGLLTPFLLLKRKFQLLKGSPSKTLRSSRISTSHDPDRIIEVVHEEEVNPLTNGDSTRKEPLPPTETHTLIEETPKDICSA